LKKEKLDDPSKHKFLLETISHNESFTEKDVKKMFETMTAQKQKVQGINIRIFVDFIVRKR